MAFSLNRALASESLYEIHHRFYDPAFSNEKVLEALNGSKDAEGDLSSMVAYQPSSRFSNLRGVPGSFDFKVAGFAEDYALTYYIPKSLQIIQPSQAGKALIFLHGGGESTATYEKAKETAFSYLADFIQYSEDKKVILLFPASFKGWGSQTRFLLREVIRITRTELPVDPDQIVIAGHSMGANAIGREFPYLGDISSGLLALSGESSDFNRDPLRLKSVFNLNYTQINGETDKLITFLPSAQLFSSKVIETEAELERSSGFKLIIHPGDHEMNMELIHRELDSLFMKKRDLYQKELFANFFSINFLYPSSVLDRSWIESNNKLFGGLDVPIIPVKDSELELNRYHWIELLDFKKNTADQVRYSNFEAKIVGNDVHIRSLLNGLKAETVRLYLSNKMLDLSQEVRVIIDGSTCFNGKVKTGLAETVRIARQMQDQKFIFDGSIDVPIYCQKFLP